MPGELRPRRMSSKCYQHRTYDSVAARLPNVLNSFPVSAQLPHDLPFGTRDGSVPGVTSVMGLCDTGAGKDHTFATG